MFEKYLSEKLIWMYVQSCVNDISATLNYIVFLTFLYSLPLSCEILDMFPYRLTNIIQSKSSEKQKSLRWHVTRSHKQKQKLKGII